MTQFPSEPSAPHDDDDGAPVDWNALLRGDADPVARREPRPGRPEPVTAPAQPRTRRELREAEQREAADASRAAEAAATQSPARRAREEAHRPSRAERRAFAESEFGDDRPRRRGPIGCLIAIVVVVALGVTAFFLLQGPVNDLIARFQPAADYEGAGTGEVLFTIHEGDGGETIAQNLVDAGVTASAEAFTELLLAQQPAPTFYPGLYRLAGQMSAQAALDALLDENTRLENSFVIPEGTAAVDALELVAEGTGIPLAELQAAAANVGAYGLPPEATSVEGFLFPATYTLTPGMSAEDVIRTLVDRQFEALDAAGVAPEDRWRTIVLASLIQREAGLRDDYYKVSRVFQNRLDPSQWPSGLLQSDATVAYGTGNTHLVTTTDAEREDASNPYNTYVHPGLPIGPISNPGDLAIDAALHPADGPWLFFVTWNLETGETIFSTTQAEHEAAVEQWLQWMDEHPEYG